MSQATQNELDLLMQQASFGFVRIEILHNSDKDHYDFMIIDTNPAFEKTTGISREAAYGGGLDMFFSDGPAEAAEKQLLLKQILHNKLSVELETYAHKIERWLKISVSPIKGNQAGVLFSDITPRKQVENKFATAFKMAPHSMTLSEAEEGKLVDMNDTFLALTNYTRDEALGKTTNELEIWVNPEERDEALLELLNKGEIRAREYKFKNRSGKILHGLFSASVVQINNKPHILTSIEDITARKEAQMALEVEHQKMNAMISAMPDMIFIQGIDGTTQAIYGANPDFLIAPADELIGRSIRDIFPQEEYERHTKLYHECISKGTTATLEYELVINNQTQFFETRISPLDETRLLTVVRNITETKKMQEAISNELSYRNFLFETDREGLLILNNDHRVVEANKKICQMLGYSHEEVLKLHTWDIDAFMTKEQVLNGFDTSLDVDAKFESVHRRKDGSIFDVELSVRSFRWKDERRVIISCRDISDRKALEEELIASKTLAITNQKRFEEIAEFTGEFIWEVDANGLYTYCNQAAENMLGYQATELVGKLSWHDLIPESNKEAYIAEVAEVFKQKAPITMLENTLIAKDGRKVRVITNGIPVIGNDGELLGYRGSDRDVTKQFEAEENLRANETKWRTTLKNLPDGVLITNTEGTITYASDRFAKNHGYNKPEDLLGLSAFIFVPDEYQMKAAEMLQKMLNGNPTGIEEYELQRKDGSRFFADMTGECLYDDAGTVESIVLIQRDITERKKTESILIENEERTKQLLKSTKTVLFEVNAEGKYSYLSPSTFELTGYQPEKLVGSTHFYELVPEVFREHFKASALELMSKKNPIEGLVSPLQTIDGRTIWIETTAMPVLDYSGNLMLYSGSSTDITEKKLAVDALTQSEKKYRLLVENINDVLFTLNPDGIISFMSPTVKDLSGFEADVYIGKHFSMFIHHDDIERIASHFEQVKAGNYFPSEYRINTLSGDEVWIRSFTKQLDESTFTGIARDITKEKAAEKALRESEAQYRMLFNTNMDSLSIVYIEPDGSVSNFVEMNDAGAAMVGYSKEELYQKSPKHLERPLAPEELEERLQQIQEKGVAAFETHIFTKEGEKRLMEIKAVLINYRNRPAIMNISRDITDRKIAEDALRQSELFANLIANSVPALLYIYDLEKQRNVWSNDAHKQYFSMQGVAWDDMNIANISKTIHPDDLKELFRKTEVLLSDEAQKQFSVELRMKEGNSWRWMSQIVSKFKRDESGKCSEILGAMFDIHERKKTEELIRQKNEDSVFLNNLALQLSNRETGEDFIKEIMSELRKHTKADFTLFSAFLEDEKAFRLTHIDVDTAMLEHSIKILGIKSDFLTKLDSGFIISKLDNESLEIIQRNEVVVYNNLHELSFKFIPRPEAEAIEKATGFKKFITISHIVSNRIYGGTVIGFTDPEAELSVDFLKAFAYLIGVTMRRNIAEKELIKAKVKAEEGSRLKSAFLASISHELRTPMNHVIGFSDLIKHQTFEPETKKYADIIYNSGQRFLTMIDDILALALTEERGVKLRIQAFKGVDLYLENRNLLHEILNNAGKKDQIKLNFKPDALFLSSIYTSDRLKINQVLTNLFKNAVKFTQKGSITFGIRHNSNQSLTFSVTDTGIGIPQDKLEIIFDFFRQADEEYSQMLGGLGIGLALSKRIANIMGASLEVESEPGRGSTFSFTIPINPMDDINPGKETIAGSKIPDFSDKKILIAEDDENTLTILKAMLKPTGVQMITAKNGQLAIDAYKINQDINLVLMDMKMPVMDGMEAGMIIKKLNPNQQLFAFTAYALQRDKQKITDGGFDGIITKPIDKFRLIDILKSKLSDDTVN